MYKNKSIKNRIGEETYNNKGCLMKIIEYNNFNDITVEFQDEYKARIHTSYNAFIRKQVKNPYYPSIYGVGMLGIKYPSTINGKVTKEYSVWRTMLRRCFDIKHKYKYPTYQNVSCCEDWLLFENFYDWLHSQENFDKWYNGYLWAVDKDILIKGNKIYSPDACCLVPPNVNELFKEKISDIKTVPITIRANITKDGIIYLSYNNSNIALNDLNIKHLGEYFDIDKAFKNCIKKKENYIKQIAKEEYGKNNITKNCYEAMMNYKIEIIN